MDNQENAVQIPDLKLDNVGDRRRKKSGLAWWSKGGSTSGSIGARGVLGGLRGLAGALSAGKVAVALLVAALSAGAYGLGKALAPNDSGFLAHRKSQLFAARAGSKYDGDLSNLPGTQRSAQSGLNMVSGSLDGMTPEEREAKAKAEADAAKAAADAQANANANAGAAPDMSAGAAKDYADPEALAAAAAGKGRGAGMEHSFGKLGSGLGGGLSGDGSGLFGGVGRPFDNTIKSSGESGKLLAMSTNRTLSATAARPVSLGKNSGRGLAQRQLNTAAMLAPSVQAGANETRSANASVPFDAGTAAAPLITGNGAQTAGQASPSSGVSDSVPTVNPASGNGSPVTGSVGTNTTSTVDDCAALAVKYGWQGTFVNSPAGGCVKSLTGTGVQDPTNTLVKIAKYLIDAAAALAALQAVMSLLWLVWPGALTYSKYLGYMLTALGAAIAGVGFTLAGMGRPELGLIYGITGGVIAAASLIGGANLMSSSIIPAITGTITGCLSLLDAGVANNTFGINKALFGKNISAPTTTSTSTSTGTSSSSSS